MDDSHRTIKNEIKWIDINFENHETKTKQKIIKIETKEKVNNINEFNLYSSIYHTVG